MVTMVAVNIYIILYIVQECCHLKMLSIYLLYSIVIIEHYLLILFIQDGCTPLLWASGYGHTAVVELLLLNNADVSICDEV